MPQRAGDCQGEEIHYPIDINMLQSYFLIKWQDDPHLEKFCKTSTTTKRRMI